MNPQLAQTITAMIMAGKKPVKRKPYKIKYPYPLEDDYATFLNKLMEKWTKLVISSYEKALPAEIEYKKSIFGDSAADDVKTAMLNRVNLLPEEETELSDNLMRISRNNKAQVNRQMNSVLGINPLVYEPYLENIFNSFVQENVDLIKSLKGEILESAHKIIKTGVTSGFSRTYLSENLQNLLNISKRRADLIARDQTGKFFGQLTKQRNLAVGIESFIWITANDLNVRPLHQTFNNNVYSWKTGAEGIFPGQEINCRCTSMAVFDPIFAEFNTKPN